MMMFLSPPSYEQTSDPPQAPTPPFRSETPLPPYLEIFRQFDTLESNPELIELRQIAQEAMEKELAKPETINKLLAEVRALAGGAKKVDDAFERVRVGLAAVDENNYRDRNGEIRKFQPTWVDFQKVSNLLAT
jgi:predicted nuclease with TOPRIM domain